MTARAICAIAWTGITFLGANHEITAAEPRSLAEVQEFAFGGVGVAGIESQGERFFREAMQRDDALSLLKNVLRNGTSAGKLYALCGIRLLAATEFSAAAAPLLKSSETVTTIHGCALATEPVTVVARQISDGSFDLSLRNPRG